MTNLMYETDAQSGKRKPRIALMGEFSAGKSTLANLMIGSEPLPMQVIATQLPPVWISYGDGEPLRVDLDGTETPCALDEMSDCPLESTAYIRIYCDEDILHLCDLIDMPGISDPNMSSEVWERMLPHCDGVIWCSHATQAWRQSEAAVWDSMPAELQKNSILLLTRSDMLLTEKDRSRVMRRVMQETEGLFSACLMISLLEARDAEDDPDLWTKSGAEPFVTHFLDVLHRLTQSLDSEAVENPFAGLVRQSDPPEASDAEPTDAQRIVPRRPKAASPGTRRLSAAEASALAARL
jgi:hypothetical protein